jgi:MFS family permease
MDHLKDTLPAGFYTLLVAYFLTISTLSIFYNFDSHVQNQGVTPLWAGVLLSLFAITALVLRPLISPFLGVANALLWVAGGTAGMIVCLLIYRTAAPLWPLALVRVFHGICYVLVASSLITWMVSLIPPNRSGLAFGFIAICNQIPFALIPLLVDRALAHGVGYWTTFTCMAGALFLVFPMLYATRRTTGDPPGRSHAASPRITLKDIRENLAGFEIRALLVFALMTYTSFAIVFFYIKGFAQTIGVAEIGPFFLVNTSVMIAVRVAGIKWFDRFDKARVCSCCLVTLAIVFVLLGRIDTPAQLYLAGGVLGLAWGSLTPLLSAMVFDFSQPRFRAMNSNLVVEMIDGGFALGPLIAGAVLHFQSYAFLFFILAVISAASLFLTIPLAGVSRSS